MSTAAQAAPKPQQPPPKPSRMTLGAVVKGRQSAPMRVMLFGQEGVGKSTFGAGAPKPIFLGAEDGTAQLDVERFPTPESWSEVREAVRALTNEGHAYRTLVVDTADAIEPLVWTHIIRRDSSPNRPLSNVEDYGFGKGYVVALDEWRAFLADLERLRAAKGMHVVLLAHSWIKLFKNPEGDDFERYELKLHAKAGGLLKEWCDAVLFARHETYAKKDERTKRVRGVSTGARLVYTERTAAYDAKNRYGLPSELPLSWEDFEAAVVAGKPADTEATRAEVERKAKELGGETEKRVLEALAKAGTNPQALAVINSRVNALLGAKES